MMDQVKLLSIVSTMSRHATQRHAVIADNIANANTPDFRAKDLQPFSEYYARVKQEQQGLSYVAPDIVNMRTNSAETINGNNVSLQEQLMIAAENKGRHELAMSVYRKTFDMMKMSIGKNI